MPTKFTKAQQLEREQVAWDLVCQGWNHRRIAGHLGIDRTTVCKLLARIYKRSREDLDASVSQKRSEFVGVLRHVLGEELEMHERAKLPKKRSSRRKASDAAGGGSGGASVETIEVVEGIGNLQALQSAKVTIQHIIALEGLSPPALLPILAEGQVGSVADIASTLKAAEDAFDAELVSGQANSGPRTDVDSLPHITATPPPVPKAAEKGPQSP